MSKHPCTGIFISSTVEDLKDYREAARDAVVGAGCFPLMMEHWPSMDTNAVQVCLNRVDQASIYIGIIAHCYGSIPQNSEISVTKMESDRAKKNEIPRLFFLVDPSVKWDLNQVERDDVKKRKLEEFKEEINTQFRRTFTSPASLEAEILKALFNRDDIPKPKSNMKFGAFSLLGATLPIRNSLKEGVSKMTLLLDGTVKKFTQYMDNFRSEIARILGVSTDEVKVPHVTNGSVWVQLELPTWAAEKFYQMIYTASSQERVSFPKKLFDVVSSLVYLLLLTIIELVLRPLLPNSLNPFLGQLAVWGLEIALLFGLVTNLLRTLVELFTEIKTLRGVQRLEALDGATIRSNQPAHEEVNQPAHEGANQSPDLFSRTRSE